MIDLVDVSKEFRLQRKETERLEVLRDISISVGEGQVYSIIGPSGCGKTTLLRIIAGLEEMDSGSISINGKEVSGPGRDRGLVFQTFNLFPWMTVKQNVDFVLFNLPTEEREERAKRYINLVGLSGFESYHPHEISGGMQQRVGIARALAIEPSVLLLDEPLANVDSQTAELLVDELLKIFETTKKTAIYVTHNMDEAIYVSDRIIVLSKRPGVVKETFDVNLPRPRWKYDIRSMPEFISLRSKLRNSLGLAK
ncbi:MAG TPA: ABC transporter ATP-binding protein [Nitrososphaerales archaeon]|nr:ABC transporter ATP-binding protein [Nitrososphaerales archaeon]